MLFGIFATFMAGLPLTVAVAVMLIAELAAVISQLAIGAVQTRRASEAKATSAALAERGLIAREIHDVLANTLAALSVQLQAAHALLERTRLERTPLGYGTPPDGNPHLLAAIGCVNRATHLAREGLVETRRAIHTLDTDPMPLPDQLAALIREHHSDHAHLTVTGTPTRLRPEAWLTLYRTTQEALANAGKHAPGAAVTVCLDYTDEHTTITVTNAPPDSDSPVTAAGREYGLAGLRERVELAGGTLTAAPHHGDWQVRVRIPR